MVYLLAAVAVLLLGGGFCFLHERVHRFGFGPLFLLVGGVEIAMYAHSHEPFLALPVPMPVSSVIFFPVLLSGLYFIYLVDGTDRARVLFGSMIVVAVAYQIFVGLVGWSLRAGIIRGAVDGDHGATLRIGLASVVALLVDVLVLTTAGHRFAKTLPVAAIPVALFLVPFVALSVDSIVFTAVAFGGSPGMADVLGGHLLGKAGASALLAAVFGSYFRAARLSVSPRSTFDFFLPPWDTISRGLAGEMVPRVPMESLYWSAASFGRAIELEATLDGIVRETIRLVGVDKVWVFLPGEREPDFLVSRAGGRPGEVDEIRVPVDGPSLAARVFRDGEVIDIPDAVRSPQVDPRLRERVGSRSLLAVPLVVDEVAIGSLVLVETRHRRRFSGHDITLARTLADYAAGAIMNAQTFRHVSQLNETLSAREQRLDQITSQTPAVFWSTDTDLVFTHSSGAALVTLGLKPGQVVGMKVVDFLRGADATSGLMKAHVAALQGERASLEVDLFDRIFQAHIAPLRDSTGAIVGTLGLALDVTERSRAEEQLRESREELATYHDLLTHDLANFATTILGLVERLLSAADGALTPAQEEILSRLNRQVWELNRMGENARMLARLREKEIPPAPGKETLREVVDRVAETLRAVHFDRGFTLETVALDGLAQPDVPLFDSVILNLVDNAIRHSRPSERPSIRIEAEQLDGAGVRIRVRGGRPPEPEVLPQVFRRYVRGPHSGGAGLGLALVREIVERSGGTVEARIAASPEGNAFEVAMTLPGGKTRWQES